MNSVTLQLPKDLWAYLEDQIASGRCGTPAEYVRELLRQDMERRRLALVRDLRAGLEGPMLAVSEAEIHESGLIPSLRSRRGKP